MFASPYASAPIKAIKDHATMLGFEIGDDQDVSLFALDTKSQVMAMKTFQPDVVWHGNTTMSVAATMRDCFALELGADHIMNNWALDENLPRLAGEAAEGAIGATPCAFYGQPSRTWILSWQRQEVQPGRPSGKKADPLDSGLGKCLVLWEALIRADKAGDLTGQGS
jgi:branched-chain amino acid transport system substrate-binding protein